MKKKTLLTAITTLVMATSFASCGNKTHTHNYDTEHIDWGWIETAEGDYKATATFSCTGCSESTEGHSVELEATVEKKITSEPTCVQEGINTYTAKVDFQGKQYSNEREKKTAKGEHKYKWVTTESTHYHECEVCHERSQEEPHSLIATIGDKYIKSEPTCTEDGVYHKHCEICDYISAETFVDVGSKKGHDFGEDGHCIYCKKDMKDALELQNASEIDLIKSKTLTDFGLPSPYAFTGGDAANKYITHDFVSDEGFNLTFRMNFSRDENTKVFRVYVFNHGNEDGGVFCVNFSGSDDGSLSCGAYLSSGSSITYGSNTTFKKQGESGTAFYFPKVSGIKSDTNNVFNVRGILLNQNDTTQTFRIQFRGGIVGGDLYNLTDNVNDTSNTEKYFDIELDCVTNNKIRLNSNGTKATMQDATYPKKEIVLKNEDGTIYGKKTYRDEEAIVLPTNVAIKNKKFVGWFDTDGNRVKNNEIISSSQVLTARYVDSQTNMLVPSDFGYDTKDKWFKTTVNTQKALSSISEDITRLDLYFRINIKAVSSGVEGIIFCFPCESANDATTAINFRFDARTFTDGQGMRYYHYSAGSSSIGGAASNTFRAPNISLSETGTNLLVHLSATKDATDNKKIVAGYEIIDLRNGEKVSASREVTFEKELNFLNPEFMKFGIKTEGLTSGDYSIQDAF